jgi:uncharacterized membrane protein
MYEPPPHKQPDNGGEQPLPPPPRYSDAPIGNAKPTPQPAARSPQPEPSSPQPIYKSDDLEVYPSYEAYLAAQQGGQTRDLRGVVDEGTDRTLSAVAHGAIAFGIFGIGLLVSLAISGFLWLYSKRSGKVRFHAEQAGCYQIIVLAINAILIVIMAFSGGFAIFQNVFRRGSDYGTPWILCVGMVIFGVWFLITIGYGLYGAVQVLRGRDFKYVLIGEWTRKRLS